jgi:tetratricopeptide (TPR) repeat protein
MRVRLLSIATLLLASGVTAIHAQTLPPDTVSRTMRERAQPPYKAGLDAMRREDYPAAVKQYQASTEIDQGFEMAHYMLGRAQLALRSYVAAVQALTRARDLYMSQGTTQFTSNQERERYRRDRINTLEVTIDSLRSVTPQTQPIREEIRRLEEQKRQVDDMDRVRSQSQPVAVPAFVSLSRGSAYFRSGKLAEAEKAYLDAVAADPKAGEAHNNLAVVYMETGRLDDAERAVRDAEKAGFRVQTALKDEIKARRGRKKQEEGRRKISFFLLPSSFFRSYTSTARLPSTRSRSLAVKGLVSTASPSKSCS